MTKSSFTQNRAKYQPKLPSLLKKAGLQIEAKPVVKTTKSVANSAEIKKLFPHIYGKPTLTFAKAKKASKKAFNVGVVLSGGQAPGGHNVVSGILDGIKASSPKSNLIGFLGGPSGLIENKFVNLTPAFVKDYRNTGGFDIIGSGRKKLETEEQFASALSTMQAHKLDALVIVGGDDSNTNACMLAEYIAAKGSPISVIGVPKTIDGDLKNSEIGTSFGFDTASKVYSELVGNICRDANSAKKYWHFIKLMGRSASHITLEVALQTQPNLTFISEEIAEKKMTLDQVVKTITDAIVRRSEMKKNFGVIVIPEGLIEFIPEVKKLIAELNDLLAGKDDFATLGMDDKLQFVNKNISAASAKVFSSLPMLIKSQLLMDRDPHGNVQVSRIETDKLLIDLVGDALRELKQAGKYKGKFSALSHFFGYEGRCAGFRWRQRIYVHAQEPGRARREVGAGRRAPHHDDEHGASSRQGQTRHQESSGRPEGQALQDAGRQQGRMDRDRILSGSRRHPVLGPVRCLRRHDQDAGAGTEKIIKSETRFYAVFFL